MDPVISPPVAYRHHMLLMLRRLCSRPVEGLFGLRDWEAEGFKPEGWPEGVLFTNSPISRKAGAGGHGRVSPAAPSKPCGHLLHLPRYWHSLGHWVVAVFAGPAC